MADHRIPESEVDAIFLDRWSPRAFLPEPLDERTVATLFEAARWAPSCNNDQPWTFVYATSEADRARFLPLLVEKNRAWAQHAPLVGFVVARRHFSFNAQVVNRWAGFDAGAAWMALCLQARRLGLYTHGMGGFDQAKSYEVLGVPEATHEVIAAFVVGRKADPATLSEEMRARETPNGRKPRADVAHEGGFKIA